MPGIAPDDLEVLVRQPSRRTGKAPVVFVHGAYVGAWCWDELFLPYFARNGHRAVAVSLRGHGRSPCPGPFSMAGIDDYVSDLETVVASLGEEPVLVGHSMGGLVVARYVAKHPVRSAVLLAPVPSDGLSPCVVHLAFHDPLLLSELNLVQFGSPVWSKLQRVRRALFSESVEDAALRRHFLRMQPESQRAICEMSFLHLAPLPVRLPVRTLVLGAGNDGFFTPPLMTQTARAYGATLEQMPGIAHAMMLEPDWQVVADRIIDWIAAGG